PAAGHGLTPHGTVVGPCAAKAGRRECGPAQAVRCDTRPRDRRQADKRRQAASSVPDPATAVRWPAMTWPRAITIVFMFVAAFGRPASASALVAGAPASSEA